MTSAKEVLHRLTPNTIVALSLTVWWLLNLVMAGGVELANDEAYYWWWATGSGLDWGYYDHPPAVALLIWLTQRIPGEFGVRLATTLLQPAYLFILWRLWISYGTCANRRSALVFSALCFSLPLLQLYGLLALPDAPLLFSSTLFLVLLNRLHRKPSTLNAALVGLSTALVGYSKYQGLIVVATGFALYVANGKRHAVRYAAIWLLSALTLYSPHLVWLYRHDFAPLRYHLVERSSSGYRFSFTLEYILNLVAVFNPLLVWFIVKGIFVKTREGNAANTFLQRLMSWTLAVYGIFFFLASFKGRTQPQWNLVAAIPAVWLVMNAYSGGASLRQRKVLHTVLCLSVAAMLCFRIVVLLNPFHLNGELWNNRAGCKAIAEVAQNRPVVVQHNYTLPCKYIFYTHREACCIPVYFERNSQWQYTAADSSFAGRSVLVVVPDWTLSNVIHRQGASDIHYVEIERYLPLSRVKIKLLDAKNTGQTLQTTLQVTNPYPYPLIPTAENNLAFRLSSMIDPYSERSCQAPLHDTVEPFSTSEVTCTFQLGEIAETLYKRPLRFCIESHGLIGSINSTPTTISPQE